MAKFGWNPGRLPDLQRKLAVLPTAIRAEGEKATRTSAELGAEEMRDVIQNSGTGWEGRPGRVDTGSMLESVVSEGNRFGWLRNYREYFGMQDSGFVNLRKNSENEGRTWITGTGGPPGTTEAMKAMDTARLVARGTMYNLARKALRKAWSKT